MSISITRYVDITSGVGAGSVVPTRDLVGRLFTGNNLVPPQSFISFSDAVSVGDYFGTTSEEYYRALFYFSFISKSITQAASIQYARWVNVAVAPMIFSLKNNNTNLSNWTSITSGSFILTMGAFTFPISGLDFSAALSLADVAAVIGNAIETNVGGGALWTLATVAYAAGGFNLVGGATGTAAINVVAGGGGTDITGAGLLGWLPESINTNGNITLGSIWAVGSDVETLSDVLSDSSQASTNFGSFLFLTNLDLTIDQVVELATLNYTLNNLYLYTVGVTPGNASAWATALEDIGGVALTLSPTLSPLEYPEMAPMILEAATNYDSINAVQNYMFQIFNLTPSVTTDSEANAYDAIRINYYGQTQTAGAQIEFYQRGVMQGPPTSPQTMSVYVNEIWLKDAATAALATMLLAQTQVPANQQGESIVLGTLQSVINSALNNGTISVNKTLTTAQQMYVTSVTGDPNAWRQVQDIGYWLNCTIVSVGPDYEAVYVLVYSKNDVINFVEGTHILI